jgi:alpha-L-fucosidase
LEGKTDFGFGYKGGSMMEEFILPAGPFEPSWESLEKYEVPKWYLDAKFGIFIHWGPYCVPAFENEWYPRNMYIKDSPAYNYHLQNFGPHSKFGYKDFIPLFKAEKWDPYHWVELFKRAGARYIVPVAEHHDGFAMYEYPFTSWNAFQRGPRRDIVDELAKATRENGLYFGVSYHRAEHWWFFHPGKLFDSDVNNPEYEDFYGPAQPENTQPDEDFLDDWLRRMLHLVDKYEPFLFWFDWWIEQPAFAPYLKFFAAYYYNKAHKWGEGVVINYKNQAFPEKAAVLDIERGQLGQIRPLFWQTDTSICRKSWGYIKDHDYRSAEEIIRQLVDIVSKNGCLLLNVAPRADGTIPEEQESILLKIGDWLSKYGEAIYGTRPWRIAQEGPTSFVEGSFKDGQRIEFTPQDIRFTQKGDFLYAIFLNSSEEELFIKSLGENGSEEVREVKSLPDDEKFEWRREKEGLRIKLKKPKETIFALKLRIK